MPRKALAGAEMKKTGQSRLCLSKLGKENLPFLTSSVATADLGMFQYIANHMTHVALIA
jgi:hypothetical protein